MHPKVDEFLEKVKYYPKIFKALRPIVLDCGLTEEYKWRQPCYTHKGKNILILGEFKSFVTLAFFKGVLLKDEENILVQQGKNTYSARIIKLTDVNQVQEMKDIIQAYIYEAIEVEEAGLVVKVDKSKDYQRPEEVVQYFQENPELEEAFNNLTPGRQRAYLMFFSAAKQSNTKLNRIKKYESRIMDGYGMNDCVCGHSKRMPNCDGSHKNYA